MAFDYWQPFEAEGLYHMYNKSVATKKLFLDRQDYEHFLLKLKQYLLPYMDFWSYCLLPNHYHLLVSVKPISSDINIRLQQEQTKAAIRCLEEKESAYNNFLEDQMRRLFSSYALSYRHKYDLTGALFQKRFKRVQISLDMTIIQKIVYLHHNPIHHGLVADYEDWRYSSYSSYFSDQPTSIVRSQVLQWLGDGDEQSGLAIFKETHKHFKLDYPKKWQLDRDE